MPSHPDTLDHRLDRLFTLLETSTLRSRERFVAQQTVGDTGGAPALPAHTAAAGTETATATATATVRAPVTTDDHLDRLFTLLGTCTLRSRERFLAQQGTAAVPAAAQAVAPAAVVEPVAAAATPRSPAPDDNVARLFDLLAAGTLRRREAFIAQQRTA